MFIALFHGAVILAFYASPFLISWKIIAVIVILYYVQLLILGNCVLTLWQFEERDRTTSFNAHVLEMMGFHPDRERLRIVVDYIIPWFVFVTAILYQVVLGHHVWP